MAELPLRGDVFLVAARLVDEAAIHEYVAGLVEAVQSPFELVTLGVRAAAARAFQGESLGQLVDAVDRALVALTQNDWPELLIAPPGADGSTWYGRPQPS